MTLTGLGPSLGAVVDGLVRSWPAHAAYIGERFGASAPDHLRFCDGVARRILGIAGERLGEVFENYRWTCERMLEEEYHFAMTGRYRHDSFAEVERTVYRDAAYMRRYTDGLLLSQLMWANHALALEVYERRFLPLLDETKDLLEVGPGHGLLLAAAGEHPHRRLYGWDVSAASLAATERALRATGAEAAVLQRQDLLAATGDRRYAAVVASELVEHLERPADALRRLAELAGADGHVYLNIPVNSPAPDHIALWRSPEELFDLVAASGLRTVERHVFPMTGRTEPEARARNLTLTCVAICQPD
jgi:2-polyprenyl-3-methyl-5-hydroxy-6-metoxy-1,4-benzoquinol methylase